MRRRTYSTASKDSNGQYIVLCASGALYVSSDWGATWVQRLSISFAKAVVSQTGQYMAAYSSSVLYVSTDYGVTWSQLFSTSTIKFVGITADGSNLEFIYYNGTYSYVYNSTNYTSYTQIGYMTGSPYSIYMTDCKLYMTSSTSTVYGVAHTFGNTSFDTSISIPAISRICAANDLNNNIICAVYGGVVKRYSNGWINSTSTTTDNWSNIRCSDDGNYVLLLADAGIYHSTDNGGSLGLAPMSSPTYPLISTDGKYMVCQQGSDVWISSNYGSSFFYTSNAGVYAMSRNGKVQIQYNSSSSMWQISKNYGNSFSNLSLPSATIYSMNFNNGIINI